MRCASTCRRVGSVRPLSSGSSAISRSVFMPTTCTAFAVLSHLGDPFEPYQHIAGVGDEGGTDMVTVAALQRWVSDDDDMLGLLTIGGRPVY